MMKNGTMLKRFWMLAAGVMLSVSVAACGGSGSGSGGSGGGSGDAKQEETLGAADEEKAKRLAEIDRQITEALLETDYEKALSMKEEMIGLAEELGLSEEYKAIAEKIDQLDTEKNGAEKDDAGKEDTEKKAESSDSLIEFDEVLVAENDTVALYLVSFYAKDVNWSAGAQNEKYISFKAKNKSDHKIFLNPDKFYLNDEKCYVSMADGSISLDAGRSGTFSFCVGSDTKPEHTALKSLDELYGLEGAFSGLHDYDDPKKNKKLEISFSLPKALNGGSDAGDAGAADTGSAGQAEAGAAASVSEEEIDEMLQGTWVTPENTGSFTFTSGKMAIMANGVPMNGTYKINTQDSVIDGEIPAPDATVKIHIPYTITDGVLTVYDNRGGAMEKQ